MPKRRDSLPEVLLGPSSFRALKEAGSDFSRTYIISSARPPDDRALDEKMSLPAANPKMLRSSSIALLTSGRLRCGAMGGG